MATSTASKIQASTDAVNKALAELAGAKKVHQAVAAGIRDHEASWYAKPVTQTYADGAEIFAKAAADEKMVEPYTHTFKHRPWDVSLAFMTVCKETYGSVPTALPPTKNPMTGDMEYPSTQIEIPIGPYDSVTIPYGTVEFLPLRAKVTYDATRDPRLGVVGQIEILAPRKLHDAARGLCLQVEAYLKEHSIYKGRAITSHGNPVFLDPYKATNREEIIWTREVDAALRGSILNVIKYTDRAKSRGQKVHRSVLFKGEPGNGKSETINIVAQICEENGWTYILGQTTLQDALTQARMYAPAVIALEDFDRLVKESKETDLSDLLEELDGTSAKGHDIMLVTTTNFIDDLNQRVRRRMAKEIEFGPFDAEAAARYLEVRLKMIAAPDIDYGVIATSMDGWGNSYISKVVEFASGIALEHESPELTTQDLLDAAEAQRPDWEAYKLSKIRPDENKLDQALVSLTRDAVKEMVMTHPQLGVLEAEYREKVLPKNK